MHSLQALGFDHYINRTGLTLEHPHATARVIAEYGTRFTVQGPAGTFNAVLPKTLRISQESEANPKVGDWVTTEHIPGDTKVKIIKVLPRYSQLSRKKAGKKLEAQIIASNVDTVYVVESLTSEFDANRIERFLVVPETAGTAAALILTKGDAVTDGNKAQFLMGAKQRFPHLPIIVTSTKTKEGIEELKDNVHIGETIVLIGPSGVGKSSLINTLLGAEALKTQEVRQTDDKGRHTTTVRQLITLENGGVLIDTPGMRELQLWGDPATTLDNTFNDIELLAKECRFTNCDHVRSSGCAILAAIAEGTLDIGRYNNYLKLKRELEHHAASINYESMLSKKKREKKASKNLRTIVRLKRGKR